MIDPAIGPGHAERVTVWARAVAEARFLKQNPEETRRQQFAAG